MNGKPYVLLVLSMLCLAVSVGPVLAEDPNTSLLAASLQGDQSAVTSLLTQGADLDATDGQGRTALLNAVENGHRDIVQFLLEAGAKINVKTINGETPFLLAARNNQPQILQLLMEKSVDGRDYFSALYLAAKYNHPEVITVLGERINLKYSSEIALCLAAKYGSNDVISIFIEEGANVNYKGIDIEAEDQSPKKWTPLMLAVAYDQLETAELLLTQGKARSSEKDEDDKNALMLACEKGNTPMVALLMDHGATLTSWDNDGWTPLMYAAKNGRVEVIKLMIERYPKQNLNRTHNKNETALAIAIAHNQTMVVEVLKAAGAK